MMLVEARKKYHSHLNFTGGYSPHLSFPYPLLPLSSLNPYGSYPLHNQRVGLEPSTHLSQERAPWEGSQCHSSVCGAMVPLRGTSALQPGFPLLPVTASENMKKVLPQEQKQIQNRSQYMSIMRKLLFSGIWQERSVRGMGFLWVSRNQELWYPLRPFI